MGDGGMLIGQCRYPPCTLSRWMEVKATFSSFSQGLSSEMSVMRCSAKIAQRGRISL